MKKSIRPPENWQDFETLCKKLFGEIWNCSNTIKKNGRLGQSQSGVDIYGKPKGENDYFGIQCKGKDNYLHTKLSKEKIDLEINKALLFNPKLKVFIFATTAPKDVEIEEHIRLKDIESNKSGNFDILLYCWQDIADLIDEHRNTFNWYMDNIHFKDQFDINIEINTEQDNNILKPKFHKIITEYKIRSKSRYDIDNIEKKFNLPFKTLNEKLLNLNSLKLFKRNINNSWCKIIISINNSGSKVIDDWKFWLFFDNNTKKINDDFNYSIYIKDINKYRTTWDYDEEMKILYKPLNNSPLIQKDIKSFSCYCIPNFDAKEITLKWQLLARDYDKNGEFFIKVEPEYIIQNKTFFVEKKDDEKIITDIEEYITEEDGYFV